MKSEYRQLSEKYEKLLKEVMKITRVGDMNQRKLMDANQQIENQKSELEELNRQLRKANITKDKFYSIVAHDLRNPLQFLLLSSELMDMQYREMEPEEIQKYFLEVTNTAQNMSDLLENLLAWSRSQYGQIECRPTRNDLHLLLAENIKFFCEGAERKQVRLMPEVPPHTLVYADPDMVRTILRNLIGNAIKFTRPGGMVRIFSKPSEQEVLVSVLDTGVGIPPKKIDTLFSLSRDHR